MVIILMGVSGSGKTLIGQLLAKDLGWPFYDGDDFHPQANIDKMSRGIPLNDEDRKPWLDILQQLIHKCLQEGQQAILACSALKQAYRDHLLKDNPGALFVYLKGTYDLILRRLQERKGHYMKADLLTSQFNTLEEPKGVLTIDVDQEPETIVQLIKQGLGLDKN